WRLSRLPDEDLPQLVFLPGLEDRQHRIAGLELQRAVRSLGLAVADDRDHARAFGKCDVADRLAGTGGVRFDHDLDDLEILLAKLEQVNQPVLRYLVLDQPEDRR